MTLVGARATLSALNRDWDDLTARHPSLPTSWRLASPALRPPGSLGDVLERVRADPDAVLFALLRLHRAGDELAGRTVVQTMLGKLVRMSARDADASLEEYLAALWVRVATYPLQRRPRSVAANLALDTLKAVKSSVRQQQCHLPAQLSVASPTDPLGDADAVLDAGVRLGVIDATTRATMRCVYVDGRTSASAGTLLGLSADAVRWRCSKGVRALRGAAPALVDALAG